MARPLGGSAGLDRPRATTCRRRARRRRDDRPQPRSRTRPGIVVPHEQRFTRPRRRRDPVAETVDIPEPTRPTCRGSGPCSRRCPASRRCAGSAPGRTRRTRIASAAASSAAGDSTVTDQYVPYIRPQENGGHADVRWLELRRRRRAAASASTSTSRARSRRPTCAPPTSPPRPTTSRSSPVAETIVHLDAAHRGLGTASCGPDTLPEYLVGPGTYRWSWTLRAAPAALTRCRSTGRPTTARVPPPQRADQLRHAGPRQRHARPPPLRGALAAGPLVRPPRAGPVRRLHEPRRRPGRRSTTRRPGPATTGSRRCRRARRRLDRRSTCATASTGSSPASRPAGARPARDLRRGRRRGRHARGRPRRRPEPASRSTCGYTIFRDRAGHRPQRHGSATTARPPSA